ncbi:MAG: class I SAM-dependent methyltransferase [Methanoregula sp.]|jgi:SAM-dependent methyltransferase|uniref:class I SAM-dependent methyltransferase n=1 Tax=Methanoregula sp. TaxID=2052170 RepID=UPI0025E534C2|nr:class I SAM-dependent methyltransferase [Methanoregula sp.]MCK9630622.1 class I SAM-dependent methyltransferase [Methanoregula sp.]
MDSEITLRSDSRYWRDIWRQMKLARMATPGFESAGAYWSNKKNVTDHVKSRTRQSWQGKVDVQFRAMNIPAGARVLDIGGGTGTHAIPLAAMGCDVTVVEPSAAMREELQKNLTVSGAGPLAVIPSRWEDVSREELGGPFDIVMASYSLSMMDIGEAIEKMEACCRGTVHLFWFLTSPSWARVSRDLWPRLYGRNYPGEPLADCLWQILYEMGIYANLMTERKKETIYQSIEDAVGEYSRRLNCTTKEPEEILGEYFRQQLHPCGKGYELGGVSCSAHIWWDPAGRR